MRIAYVDMIGGAAGDMLLAAFLDAGLDREALERALRGVVAGGWALEPRRVTKRGIAATYAGLTVPGEDGDEQHHHHDGHDVHAHDVHAGHHHGNPAHDHHGDDAHHHGDGAGARTLADVLEIVERSTLTPRQRERASAVYRALADAEARTHGTTGDAIRFREGGPVDAIL